MKYIRTKDSIYEVVREICEGEAYEVKVPQSKWDYDEDNKCYYESSKLDDFYKREIIKEADTIEELCDEFIAHNHKASPDVKDVFSIKEELNYALDYMEDGYTIYGAVWCEWGLKYVAKLDDKGEFQLL